MAQHGLVRVRVAAAAAVAGTTGGDDRRVIARLVIDQLLADLLQIAKSRVAPEEACQGAEGCDSGLGGQWELAFWLASLDVGSHARGACNGQR